MVRRTAGAILALFIFVAFSSPAFAQDAATSDMKKDEKHSLKSVSCAPDCGFKIRSHDEQELTSIVLDHVKKYHGKDATAADVRKMMKEEKMEMHKEVYKEKKRK